MSAGRVCSRVVAVIEPQETIREAARRMAENDVGTLIVVDEESRPTGIVTDRDIVTRSVARGLDPEGPISGIMSSPVRWVREAAPIEEALSLMAVPRCGGCR